MGKAVVSVHIKATDPEKALSEAHKVCEDMGVEHSTIQASRCTDVRFTARVKGGEGGSRGQVVEAAHGTR